MKQFFKYTLATILGVILAGIILVAILFGIAGGIAGQKSAPTKLKPNSVYELKLNGVLVERSEEDPFSIALAQAMGNEDNLTIGLNDILSNIQKAKTDENIAGIYLNFGTLSAGYASMKEIRDALKDFKKSGKFVVAYADNYLQHEYYLASVADKIFLNPQGMLDWKGLASEITFYKNTLDKLGIEMQVVKVGTFKSAVEPYVNTKMSDANREQVTVYLNSIWNTLLSEVSDSRKIPFEKLNVYADEMLTFQPTEKAKQYALVDSLVYQDEIDFIVKGFLKDSTANINYVGHEAMCKVPDASKYDRNKIAVLYAAGAIDNGSDGIKSKKLVKTINEIAKDNSVKAVVFRVNSPGGSAYGSEQIWHALSQLKQKKPLIVSMGDYAASGGYYISCIADSIVAQPNTITGSIGIFGLIPNIEGLDKKIGLTFDGVKTNKMSDAISINRPFRPEERDLMQNYVNRGYELFVKRCADGRKMSVEQIKAIAEGRVWTGKDAMEIGLVDKLGTINDAISMAVKKAKLTSYQIKEFPKIETFSEKLLKELSGGTETRIEKLKLGEHYQMFKMIEQLDKMDGLQARLPYELTIR